MSETRFNTPPHAGSPLNEYQARRLRVTCQYIDKLLGDVDSILHASESKTAFPRYSSDFSPEQRGAIEEHVARLRARMIAVLDSQGIAKQQAPIPALHAINVAIDAIGIEIEELLPENMRGYGELQEAAARELTAIVEQLRELTTEFDAYLHRAKSP
ncbi:MAG TPA: hypothetical protein VHX36_17245 [Candidatus Acidoferrales bacterium]|jgi:hypothetical protein|nr:hypothetical protein [Candidatus Acidoferrales bacterium]